MAYTVDSMLNNSSTMADTIQVVIDERGDTCVWNSAGDAQPNISVATYRTHRFIRSMWINLRNHFGYMTLIKKKTIKTTKQHLLNAAVSVAGIHKLMLPWRNDWVLIYWHLLFWTIFDETNTCNSLHSTAACVTDGSLWKEYRVHAYVCWHVGATGE